MRSAWTCMNPGGLAASRHAVASRGRPLLGGGDDRGLAAAELKAGRAVLNARLIIAQDKAPPVTQNTAR